MIKFKYYVRTDRGEFESVVVESPAKELGEIADALYEAIPHLETFGIQVEGGGYMIFPKGILQNSIINVVPVV